MYENTLSQVLLNIKIARRKFMPKTMAKSYSSHLSKVITNLLDYLSKNKFPKTWPDHLADYELVTIVDEIYIEILLEKYSTGGRKRVGAFDGELRKILNF